MLNSIKRQFAKIQAGFRKLTSSSRGSNLATPITTLNSGLFSPRPSGGTTTGGTLFGGQTLAPNTSTPYGIGQTQSDGSITLLDNRGQRTGGSISSSGVGSTSASPIYSAPLNVQGGTSRSSIRLFGGGTTTGGTTTGGTTTGGTLESSGDFGTMSLSSTGGGTIGTQSSASTPAITLPHTTAVSNPGVINNGGLVGGDYTLDPNTGMVVQKEVAQDPEMAKRLEIEKMRQDLIQKKENYLDDPDIRRQQREVEQKKQEVNNYTAQLNSVVAQQNADLLRLREVGSQEGVTETVYGGQQATINREAAIKALPIQAQIAAAQGNLELAQDYLTQLTTWKREEIDNDYNYRRELTGSMVDFLNKEEALQLKEIEKEDTRRYNELQDLVSKQFTWMEKAKESGQLSYIPRINNARSEQELLNIVSGMVKTPSSSSDTLVKLSADKQRLLLGGGFTSSEASQIESDVNQYGIDQVLAGIVGESKKRAVRDVYGSASSSGSNLTRQSMASLFGIPDDSNVSGFLNNLPWVGAKQTNAEKIDALMTTIEKYQAVGYTDKEILKLMQE